MRGHLLTGCLIAVVTLTMSSRVSAAYMSEISFEGVTEISDQNNDGFAETISIGVNPFLAFLAPMGADGLITGFDPTTDPLFSDMGFEGVRLPTLMLDPGSVTTDLAGNTIIGFDSFLYTDAFTIIDDNGDILLVANFMATSLTTSGVGGTINSAFSGSLLDVRAGAGYMPGTSSIIDHFLEYSIAGATLTLQTSGDLASAIQNIQPGQTISTTYSGTAASASAVPEPTTLLLFGSALLGLVIPRWRIGQRT